jgi:hypothetical protein
MTETLRQTRTVPRIALILFVTAYAAVMVLILAPKDMLSATPGSLLQPGD